jgi:ABC-type histidine transport system ATPase subunit
MQRPVGGRMMTVPLQSWIHQENTVQAQTPGEEIANSVSHGAGVLLAVAAVPVLVVGAVRRGTAADIVGAAIFGATMVLLYLTSTLYHALPAGRGKEIFQVLKELNEKEGITLLLVEQNVKIALSIAQHAYIMENGRIVLDGTAQELLENEDIKEFYLGLNLSGGRRSYRNVKHYKRRKRWLG